MENIAVQFGWRGCYAWGLSLLTLHLGNVAAGFEGRVQGGELLDQLL